MSQTKWEIDNIKIETGRGGTADSLFANGYMQVSVIVEIKAFDPDTRDPYQLTSSDLASLKLIDYDNGSEIGIPWVYTSTPNEFDHVLPGTLSESLPSQSSAVSNAHRETYWVSTTSVEHKSIGAKITQPDGTVITTQPGTDFTSRVILTGVAAEPYRLKDLNVDNYYVSSTRYSFIKVERHNFSSGSTEPGQKDCFYGGGAKWFYSWDMSTETQTKKIELKFASLIDSYADIKVNQRPNSFCLTRILMSASFGDAWGYADWFKIFDRYGNHGSFTTKFIDNHNKLEIVESNNNKLKYETASDQRIDFPASADADEPPPASQILSASLSG